jgi:putative ABC transport system ATP-binding protein
VQRYLLRAYDRARSDNAEVLTSISEVVAGAETLRAYDAGPRYAESTKRLSRRRSRSFVRAGTIGAFLFPSGEVFSVLTVAAVVSVGVWRGPDSGLTAGAMVGFMFLTYRFLEPIAQFTEVIDQTQTAVAGLRRVLGVLEIPVGPPEPRRPVALPAGPLGIDIEHVTFTYPSRGSDDEGPVLVDVTARIPPGQQVALVGETGSGKTTLGRLVARLADPSSGVVRLGGVPLTAVANDELRTRLVVVPQEPFLFDGSIAANLVFARPMLSLDDVEAVVRDLGLGDWLVGLPDGLDTEVGQRGANLSAGERQLVALVRAALVDPDVLVLDEATSSVDALTEVRMSRALDRLSAGCTTIAIAHRLSTAARADRVLVLEQGRLVEDGPHADLVARGGAYARMYLAWVAATST